MQSAKAEPGQQDRETRTGARERWLRIAGWRYTVACIYLAVALPIALLLCYLTPPMQSPDESRHFLRACQFALGQILPQVDPADNTAGGLLPAAAVEFVRDKMNPEYYRNEDRLHSISARLRALDAAAQHQPPLSEKEFGVFPSQAVYAPALYLPQTAGIRLARFFSNKVYIWFYAARVANALTAVFLVFLALLLAPGYQLLLLIPAILPMSLYQFGSVSSDAGFISISILFAALCIRFLKADGWLIRSALVLCLLLLTLGKPVYLPFALLLLPAYKRLGWRRTISFCAATLVFCACSYLAWSYFVRPVFALAGNDFPGHNPSAQVHFILAHPAGFLAVLLHTIRSQSSHVFGNLIGFFGWTELPLPLWFYRTACAFLLAVVLFVVLNWKKADRFRFLCGSASAASMLLAIALAGFILWAPVGSTYIPWLQGRYFIPILAVLPFLVPAPNRVRRRWKLSLACLVLGFFALSVFTTVRIVNHYYFSGSKLPGKNVQALFTMVPGAACPGTLRSEYTNGWFSSIANGTAASPGNFRVLIATEEGTILGESDPVLAGREFPFDLLAKSSHRRWRIHFWTPNRFATLRYWLLRGKIACTFGPTLKLKPHQIPSA